MPFVSFSSQLVIDNTTGVSNVFMEEHLPQCNGDCARVYLYGLYLCSSATRYDNTLEHFANTLNLEQDDILSAFMYWQEQGLVQVLSVKPIEVKYLPVKQNAARIKKYSKDKYADFNVQIQSIIEGRMITPTEFAEYYAFLEAFHVEPAALVMIAKHCANLKGANVGYSYIITVAKNWAYAGVKTVEAVDEKLASSKEQLATIAKLFGALGIKRVAEPTDFELYEKWTKKLGFSDAVIAHVAQSLRGTKQSHGSSTNKLDNRLLKYYELKLFELDEIADFTKRAKDLTTLAFNINKKIGVYYENAESIVEEYLVPWQLKGFDADTLLSVASFCFKTGKRTLADMDAVISRFYKLGITTQDAINNFISEKVSEDKVIKELLNKLGATREVNAIDRDFYNTWTKVWNKTTDEIDKAAALAAGKTSPMMYLNKVLSGAPLDKAVTITQHSYSDAELRSLSISMDEVTL